MPTKKAPRAAAKPKVNEEDLLATDLNVLCVRAQLANPLRQHTFHDERKWAFDFAWPTLKIAVEVIGLGKHNRAKGMNDDYQKWNCAREAGWRVFTYLASSVRTNKRRERIVEQLFRTICCAYDPDESTIVLVGDFQN